MIVVVGAAGEMERLQRAVASFPKVVSVVCGGESRSESVANGLAALPPTCEIVLVHDAARPIVSEELISRVVEQTEAHGAAIPGLPLTDTIKRANTARLVTETVARAGLWAVQTPQGARIGDLRAAYASLGSTSDAATDESSILESAGYPVAIVDGEESNIKVTQPGDLERVARSLEEKGLHVPAKTEHSGAHECLLRTGFGYDVHAFAEGRPLWLGGVRIAHPRGLAGHSDADVVLHAVCDALLGAAGMGDIGVLFPDTDAAHKNRPSIEFVHEVRHRLVAEGWRIANLDITVLAEEPRIGAHRAQMIAVIADGLRIAPTQTNIKATTSEGMGFVGRREGIACWAVATLSRGAIAYGEGSAGDTEGDAMGSLGR